MVTGAHPHANPEPVFCERVLRISKSDSPPVHYSPPPPHVPTYLEVYSVRFLWLSISRVPSLSLFVMMHAPTHRRISVRCTTLKTRRKTTLSISSPSLPPPPIGEWYCRDPFVDRIYALCWERFCDLFCFYRKTFGRFSFLSLFIPSVRHMNFFHFFSWWSIFSFSFCS